MGCHRVAAVGTLSELSVHGFAEENCSGAPGVGAVSRSVEGNVVVAVAAAEC